MKRIDSSSLQRQELHVKRRHSPESRFPRNLSFGRNIELRYPREHVLNCLRALRKGIGRASIFACVLVQEIELTALQRNANTEVKISGVADFVMFVRDRKRSPVLKSADRLQVGMQMLISSFIDEYLSYLGAASNFV